MSLSLNEKNVVWLFGAPRSGTSWLGQIFNSSQFVNFKLQPLFSYAFKDRLNLNSSKDDLKYFLNEISVSEDLFINGKSEITKDYPKFQKNILTTHLVIKHVRYHHFIEHLMSLQPEAKFIGIIRNPYAVINSWLKAPKEFDPSWNIPLEWKEANKKNLNRVEEFYGFNKWLDLYKMYKKLATDKSNNFYLIYYHDLIFNPLDTVEKLFYFCELPFEQQTKNFLEIRKVKTNNPYSIFKSKENDTEWRDDLPKYIVDEISSSLRKEGIIEFL